MNHTLNLGFDSVLPGQQSIPMVSARIVVSQMSGDRFGLGRVSPECVSIAELEEQVIRLKGELDRVLIEGKAKFSQYLAALDEKRHA